MRGRQMPDASRHHSGRLFRTGPQRVVNLPDLTVQLGERDRGRLPGVQAAGRVRVGF